MRDVLADLERLNAKEPIRSITITYPHERHEYAWDQRHKISWHLARKCRANYVTPKVYLVDGDACERPGKRVF